MSEAVLHRRWCVVPRARRSLALATLTVAVSMAAGCGEQTSDSQPAGESAGCGQETTPIVDPPAALEPNQGLSGGGVTPNVMDATSLSDEVTSQSPYVRELGGMQAVGQDISNPDHVDVYYAASFPKGLTLPEFFAQGGVMLRWIPREVNAPSLVEVMNRDFADEVTPVEIGASQGVLTWDDPVGDSDVRAHRVTWSSEGMNFVVAALQPGEKVVNLARSVAC